jgi:hypothetical protein
MDLSKKEQASRLVEMSKMQVEQLLEGHDRIAVSFIKTCLNNAIFAIRKLPDIDEDEKMEEDSKLISR